MTIYAIGDVQGCFADLQQLLALVEFDVDHDGLWFTGDLVNRGPQSLETLRFVKSLDEKQISVLGNHDLHLLAAAYGVKSPNPSDTFADILAAPDKIELIEWLRHRPLLHAEAGYVMTHAGLAPAWTLQKASELAKEVAAELQSTRVANFLRELYGNEPSLWRDDLQGMERLRCIVNYFTRMRFCDVNGRLQLDYKGGIADKPEGLLPWFDVPNRLNRELKIIFGHWAALNGETDTPKVYPLDTGCVWGNALTAMRLGDEKRWRVQCGIKK
nr:bis(5'-nucleosyl)-tetraphosphatase (symmetrical) [uncultured bacterium]